MRSDRPQTVTHPVTVSRDKTIGYLSQHEAVSGDNTIYDELLSVKQELIDLLVGSSSMIRSGLSKSSLPRATRVFWPPERLLTARSRSAGLRAG